MPDPAMQQVIVLGAGVAGLAAARALGEAGVSVLVLEARARFGGRLLTHRPQGASAPVELGAEFIHGRPPDLLALIEEAGLATAEVAGEQACFEGGVLDSCGEADEFSLLDQLDASDDISFDEFLSRLKAPDASKARARAYVEGFNAADASRIGTAGLARQQAAEEAIEGGRSARILAGYSALSAYMARRVAGCGGRIRLNVPVASVEWKRGAVRVNLAGGEALDAEQLIPTLPLGVLQAGTVRFDPVPPSFAALDKLAMGPVQRLVLVFRERFWAEGMSFLFAREQTPRVWWTTSPRASNLLTGWIGGPGALPWGNTEQLVAQALGSLETIYSLRSGTLSGKLLSRHLHDWQADPYSRGAYSYALVGGLEAAARLAEPVADTLFFAGEHTDATGHPGTVHGALRSGLRAARQVLRARGFAESSPAPLL